MPFPWSLLVVTAAFVLVCWQAHRLRLGMASASWRAMPGRILQAWVDEAGNDDDDLRYAPKVRYAYRVGTRQFESTTLSYQPTGALAFAHAVEGIREYCAGGEVTVYVDPRRHRRAVLRPGASVDNVVQLGIGLLVFGAAVWFALP
jgi:hypothetical protein